MGAQNDEIERAELSSAFVGMLTMLITWYAFTVLIGAQHLQRHRTLHSIQLSSYACNAP